MIKNFWDKIHIYCGCHDGEMVEMQASKGNMQTFCVCPRCVKADGEHPDGHGEYERACRNTLGTVAATDIVDKIVSLKEKARREGEVVDLTNCMFTVRGVMVRVLKDGTRNIRLSVVNKAVYQS